MELQKTDATSQDELLCEFVITQLNDDMTVVTEEVVQVKNEKIAICYYCSRKSTNIEKHSLEHKTKEGFACLDCPVITPTGKLLVHHYKECHPQLRKGSSKIATLTCPKCTKKFVSAAFLRSHIKTDHEVISSSAENLEVPKASTCESLPCPYCRNKYFNISHLQTHTNDHTANPTIQTVKEKLEQSKLATKKLVTNQEIRKIFPKTTLVEEGFKKRETGHLLDVEKDKMLTEVKTKEVEKDTRKRKADEVPERWKNMPLSSGDLFKDVQHYQDKHNCMLSKNQIETSKLPTKVSVALVHGDKYKCHDCNINFITSGNLSMHRAESHRLTLSNFSCIYCDNKFTKRETHDLHYKLCHEFKCCDCNINYISKGDLAMHRSVFHDEFTLYQSHMQYKQNCMLLKKQIKTSKLPTKESVALDDKKYKCHDCNINLITKGNLSRHRAVCHRLTLNNFSCIYCDINFTRKETRDLHYKVCHE